MHLCCHSRLLSPTTPQWGRSVRRMALYGRCWELNVSDSLVCFGCGGIKSVLLMSCLILYYLCCVFTEREIQAALFTVLAYKEFSSVSLTHSVYSTVYIFYLRVEASDTFFSKTLVRDKWGVTTQIQSKSVSAGKTADKNCDKNKNLSHFLRSIVCCMFIFQNNSFEVVVLYKHFHFLSYFILLLH